MKLKQEHFITIAIIFLVIFSIVVGKHIYTNIDTLKEGFESLQKIHTHIEQLDVDAVIYINLESRPDRNEELLRELRKIKMDMSKVHRLQAVKRKWGALGATLSHISCLKFITERGWKRTLILEDDAGFEVKNSMRWNNGVNDINKKIRTNEYDVIFLGGFVRDPTGPTKTEYPTLYKTKNTSCGHAYIVRQEYAPKILDCMENAVQMIMKNPPNYQQYHLDNAWTELMVDDRWFVSIPTLAYQRESYSDIENKVANTDEPLRGQVVRAWKEGTILQ